MRDRWLRRVVGRLAVIALCGGCGTAGDAVAGTGSDGWLSLGFGYYDGQDHAPASGQPKTQAQKVGGAETVLALNVDRGVLLRLRGAWLIDYTRNTAEDVGLLLGLPLAGHGLYLAAGASRLTDVADDRQRPIVGVPVELLFYPLDWIEVSLHGNLNAHSDFIGVTLGAAFGHQGD